MTFTGDWSIIVWEYVPYPERYHEVLNSTLGKPVHWADPIVYSDIRGLYTDLNTYYVIDPDRPRCYGCGKFLKVKRKRKDGSNWAIPYPCPNCEDDPEGWYF